MSLGNYKVISTSTGMYESELQTAAEATVLLACNVSQG